MDEKVAAAPVSSVATSSPFSCRLRDHCSNRKEDRISRKIAIKSIAKGELGIPKLRDYINALKLIWVRKLKTSDRKWKKYNQSDVSQGYIARATGIKPPY